jgi:UDP-N-acetylmuramate--alanine ligase
MELDKISRVHLIGVGGIGVSAIAKMMKLMGKEVSGSDVDTTEITDELEKMGVKIFHGHYFDNVSKDVELVVYSSAVPEENPERQRARELNAQELSYSEFLGLLSRAKKTIAVAGTHGKSTTTAMLGKILVDAGLDPTVIVGSKLKSFEFGNFRFGKSEFLVVEACEFKANFLNLNPDILVVTNIEAEHLDFYRDLEDVAAAFQRLIDKLPEDGLLVYNADDRASVELLHPFCAMANFSLNQQAAYQAVDIVTEPGEQQFNILKDGQDYLKKVRLFIPGLFNIYNSLAAVAAADEIGWDKEKIKESLKNFVGLWRRLETVGSYEGAQIISDYGHHPTEIIGSIQAVRNFYPNKRLVWVFQPHHHNRTKQLFDDFIKSFGGVDVLIISDIYDVAGREDSEDQDIDSRMLAEKIEEISPNIDVRYSGDLDRTEKKIKSIIQADDVVVFQGAGTIDEIARSLVE